MNSQSSTVYLDPWGDLKIIAEDRNQEPKTLVVSSTVMRLASPVWRVMFDPNGRFREAQEAQKEVFFPDDDADALVILLRIAHLAWREVPETISFDNLAALAVLCDKYDMIHFVRPWLAKWQSRPLAIVRGPEERLFIAWTFGDYMSFVHNVKKLIVSCNTDDAGKMTRGGKLIELDFAPGLVDNMLKARKEILKGILAACDKHVNCYGPEQSRLPEAASSVVPRQWRTLVFWSLKIGLPTISAWPGPVNIDKIHEGVDFLAMQLPGRLCTAVRDTKADQLDHSNCQRSRGATLMGEVVRIYDQIMPTVFEDWYRTHMENQAKK